MDIVTRGSSRRLAWLLLAAGVLLLAAAVTASDPLGRALLAIAAVLLGGPAGRDLVLGPALVADAGGLTVVDGLRRRHVAWSQLDRVRVVTDRRSPLLELDLDGHLVVLSRRRLGAAPALVLEELEQLRPAAS